MTNDAIAFACRQCGKKMKVKSSLAGKAAKCPGCGAELRIPLPKQAQPATSRSAAAGGAARSAAAKTSAAAGQSAAATASVPASREFGLDGLRREDPFAGAGPAPANPRQNPLANHVIADPGFALGHAPVQTRRDGEVEEPSFARNPLIVELETEQAKQQEMQETIAKLKTKIDTASPNVMKSVPVLLGVATGVPLFFALIFGFTFSANVAFWIALVIIFALGPAATGVQIWGIIKVATNEQENKVLQILLFIFVPLYNLIYSIMNWKVMKGYFGALIVLSVMSGAATAVCIVMAAKIAAGPTIGG